MSNGRYFDSKAIGSSLLGTCIVSVDPLVVCTDRATVDVKPTSFMEIGRMFEDLVEAEYGEFDFWEKYFKSNFQTFPAGIIEVLENDDVVEAVEACKADPAHYKKDGNLSKTYERKFACLDQIKAHDYRRPIPAPIWEKLEIMLERFKNCPFTLNDLTLPLDEWMSDYAEVKFQIEYFWENFGAKCRAKYDMIWIYEGLDGKKHAIPFDLKVTGDEVVGQKSFGAFVGNWRKKYIWQSKHYHEGFKLWCEENGYAAYDRIPYIVQESEEPQVTNVLELHPEELRALNQPYHESLPVIQEWIDDGKPIKGFMEQQTVNRFGRQWNE